MPTKPPSIHTFSNGFRLVYEQHYSKNPQTHIRAFCHVGSIHEPENLRGATHFVEHMCFKGSVEFPSWSSVNEPFSRSGAQFNAITTKQYTCFTVDCLDSYTKQFLKILGDMMLRSKFDKKEYNLELNVVREEMKMKQNDSPIEELAFSGTVYANNVDDISYHAPGCLPYYAVIDYYHQYYVPQNMVLSIVSSVEFDTIVRYVSETQFSKQLTRPSKIYPLINYNLGALDENCSSNYKFKSSSGDTANIEIGVRVCDQFKHDDYHTLNVLRHVVSNSMSSRLFVELREKRGLTYRSGAYMTLYETAGVFVLCAISDVDRLIKDVKHLDSNGKTTTRKGVIPVMFDILDDLITHGINDSELKMAKQHIKDSLKMHSVAGGDKSAYNGIRVMLHNESNILPNSEVFDKCYKKITKSDVNSVIEKYFSGRKYYFSVIGGKLPKVSTLIECLNPIKNNRK
jgi:predicted Zn-dependent peptidase